MLICFDLGEVLVRVQPNWSVALNRQVTEGDWSDLERAHQSGLIDREDFLVGMSKRLEVPVEAVAAAHDGWLLGEMEGAVSLLAELQAAGHLTACLSNTCDCHWRVMKQWPIFRHLNHVYASHLLGAFKPDPSIYKAFSADTGIADDEIVFFDDRLLNVEAAASLGWEAIHLPVGADPVPRIRQALGPLGLI